MLPRVHLWAGAFALASFSAMAGAESEPPALATISVEALPQKSAGPASEQAVVPVALETVVITPTRHAQSADDVIAPVIVITRTQIERAIAQDVADLLRFHAGVEIGRSGGVGQNTSLFVRGADSKHTLVLIDGVAINERNFGSAPIQQLSPDMIERIEVVKGPRSTQYGGEAIGGVVNIITRKPAEGFGARAEGGLGPDNYVRRNATLSAGTRQLKAKVFAQNERTRGFPPLTRGTEDRGFKHHTVQGNLDAAAGPLALSSSVWRSFGVSEYLTNSPFADYDNLPAVQNFSDLAGRAELALTLGRSSSKLACGKFKEYRGNFEPAPDSLIPGPVSVIPPDTPATTAELGNTFIQATRRESCELLQSWAGAHGSFDFGLEANRERIYNLVLLPSSINQASFRSESDEGNRYQSAWSQYAGQWGRHRGVIGGRVLQHSDYGRHSSYDLEYGIALPAQFGLSAIANAGYRTPTPFELYNPSGGNPQVKPEHSRNYELGLQWGWRKLKVDLRGFENTVHDLITCTYDVDTGNCPVVNAGKSRNRGVELVNAFALWGMQLRLEGLLQKPVNLDSGQPALRRARRSLVGAVARSFRTPVGKLELEVNALGSSSRPDVGGSRNGGYALLNFNAAMKLGKPCKLAARLENAADKRYELAQGYRTQGRGVFSTLGCGF